MDNRNKLSKGSQILLLLDTNFKNKCVYYVQGDKRQN